MEKKRGKENFKILLKKQTMTHVSWKTGSALKIISPIQPVFLTFLFLKYILLFLNSLVYPPYLKECTEYLLNRVML